MRAMTTLVLALLCASFGIGALAHAQPPLQQSAPYNVYLPQVIGPPAAPVPTPQPELQSQGGVFVVRDHESASASAAVDAQGGMHMAAAGRKDSDRAAFYSVCTSGTACADPAQWQTVALSRNVDAVQLALTPDGKPRMLLTIDRALEESQFGMLFRYAACDIQCNNAANWAIVTVAQTDYTNPNRFDETQRSFALDPQGRPRFLYRSQFIMRDLGTFYVACDTNCSDPASVEQQWVQTKLSQTDELEREELFSIPVLVFTRAGQPRMIADVTTPTDDSLYYFACDTGCEARENWQRELLLERGQGPDAAWDLALDPHDRPRIAMYQESLPDGGDRLLYLWCNGGCVGENGWFGTVIGLEQGDGLTPDLAFDTQGRPRIAYHPSDAAGQGYLWCNSTCESNDGQWAAEIVDQNQTLDATFPLPVPPACDQAGWSTGFRPSLVLDAQGNPRIASDAVRMMRCTYTDPGDPTSPPETRIDTYHYTRFVFLPQP